MKTIYYWESDTGSGEFSADSDEEAINQAPKSAFLVYKESDTPDGRPFISVFSKPGRND